MLSRQVEDVDVFHKEFLELVLIVWLLFLIDDEASVGCVIDFCNYSFSSCYLGNNAESEIADILTL